MALVGSSNDLKKRLLSAYFKKSSSWYAGLG